MSKTKSKPKNSNSTSHLKVNVFLQVPDVLHGWLRDEAEAGGFKNVQDKILDLLRSAREVALARAA